VARLSKYHDKVKTPTSAEHDRKEEGQQKVNKKAIV